MSDGSGARRDGGVPAASVAAPEGAEAPAGPLDVDVEDVGPMEPPVVVAADVHLSPERPDVSRRFEAFLDRLAGRGGTLFLLGDVFDWWVGPAQAREAAWRPVLDRLARLAATGTAVLFVGGNRDFAFEGAEADGVRVLADPVLARWGDRTVVLTHGDLLCSADARYQRMRRVLRSGPARALLRAMPYRAARYLARGLRDVSEREVRRKPYATMGIDYGLARRWLEALDADVLVAGHVHTGVHHRLAREGRQRDVVVVKDWERGGGVARWDGERVELVAPTEA